MFLGREPKNPSTNLSIEFWRSANSAVFCGCVGFDPEHVELFGSETDSPGRPSGSAFITDSLGAETGWSRVTESLPQPHFLLPSCKLQGKIHPKAGLSKQRPGAICGPRTDPVRPPTAIQNWCKFGPSCRFVIRVKNVLHFFNAGKCKVQ